MRLTGLFCAHISLASSLRLLSCCCIRKDLYRNPLPNLFTHSQLADAIPFHFETRFRLKGKREERTN